MKVVFVSNLFNHHQKYLSDQLYELSNHNYYFIATMAMTEELKALGYYQYTSNIPYVINAFESAEKKDMALKKILESDVLIYGSAPKDYIYKYKRFPKVVFRYSERIFRNGKERLKFIPRLLRWRVMHRIEKNEYLLCASAYAATDFHKFGLYKNKCYKWGYFPKLKVYDCQKLFVKKDVIKIIWVGRLIELKHPEYAIQVAERLKTEGIKFSMEIIGTGKLEQELKNIVREKRLYDCVTFLGAIKSENVRNYMENAGIFIFTSDKSDGWGAVLNESMNSGCAVVASDEIGSVPFLINHNDNGLIFKSGDVESLYANVRKLIENPKEQRKLGENAYHTILEEWNSEIAATRLLTLAQIIIDGKEALDLYSSGPCSKATIDI